MQNKLDLRSILRKILQKGKSDFIRINTASGMDIARVCGKSEIGGKFLV
jgi:hypothetical protein